MPNTPEVDILQEAGQLARRTLMEQARALYGVVMGTDGETFGDTQMTRSDRILRWVTAAQDGTLDVLQAQSPRIYDRELRTYQHDLMDEIEAAAKARA